MENNMTEQQTIDSINEALDRIEAKLNSVNEKLDMIVNEIDKHKDISRKTLTYDGEIMFRHKRWEDKINKINEK